VNSFVCFAREGKKEKNGGTKLVGKHIVRIEPAWLDGLDEHPAGVALRLRGSLDLKHVAVVDCAKRVAAEPEFGVESFQRRFKVGDTITATVLRPPGTPDGNGIRWILSIENETGVPVLLKGDRSFKKADAKFKAVVEEIDTARARVVVSQFGLYKPGQVVEKCRIDTTEKQFEDDGFEKVFVRLPGNVRGRLLYQHIPFSYRKHFEGLKQNDIVKDLFILSIDPEHGISLCTKTVHANLQLSWTVGQEIEKCTVEELDWTKDRSKVVGVYVQIRPGIPGYLPLGRLSYRDRTSAENWKPGDTIPVLVIERIPNKMDYWSRYQVSGKDVLKAASLEIRVGDKMSGTVIGFDKSRETGQVTAVKVETAPGRADFIPIRLLGNERMRDVWLSELRVGRAIEVMVTKIVPGGECELQLALPDHLIDRHFRGYISGFLPGKGGYLRGGVFVEIIPGTSGLLHYTAIPSARLDALKEGDAIKVVVSTCVRESGKWKIALKLP